VYRVKLGAGQRLKVFLRGPAGTETNLILCSAPAPVTSRPVGGHPGTAPDTVEAGGAERVLSYTAPAAGWHYVEVKMSGPGSGRYSLRIAKTR
jgi:hypothetical protein